MSKGALFESVKFQSALLCQAGFTEQHRFGGVSSFKLDSQLKPLKLDS